VQVGNQSFLRRPRGRIIRPPTTSLVVPPAQQVEVTSWIAQVVTNGGTVSAARRQVIDQYVIDLKAAGVWALYDEIILLVAENAIQALTSLKQRRLATVVAAPTFIADGGYSFDGVASYIDTGFIPLTHQVVATADSVRVSFYLRAPLGGVGGGFPAGARVTGAKSLRVRPLAATLICDTQDVNSVFTSPGGAGYVASSKIDATLTSKRGFHKGAPLVRATDPSAVSPNSVDCSVWLGAVNLAGVLNSPCVCTIGMLGFGAPLTDPQEVADYNAIQRLMTTLGAQV